MDPEFPSPPVQGVSDLRACYDHALDVLVKAGADLDRVGTELNRVEVTFHNAVNEYLSQLQSQIDNKDKAIRLMVEQKVETIDVMCSMQNQLVKLQDENTMLKLGNKHLSGILYANPSYTGNVLPLGILGEDFSGNPSTDQICP